MKGIKFIFNVFFLISFIYSSSLDSYIDKVNEEIEALSKSSKLSGCSYLLKVSLSEGNDKIRRTIKNYTGNKSKAYDFLVLCILSECSKKISEIEIEMILHPDKFETIHKNTNKLMRLIDFNEDILINNESLELDNELIEVSGNIKKAMNCEAYENRKLLSNNNEIDILGMKILPSSENKWIIIVMLFILICFGLVIMIIFNLINKKKQKKNKKNNQKEE